MRITRYAVAPVAATALALTACGGDTGRTYDASGQVVDKEIDHECDTHADGAGTVEVELVSYQQGRSSGGSGSRSRNTSTSGGGSGGTSTSGGPKKSHCHTEYEIYLRDVEDDVEVTESHYNRCEVGEQFPRCTGNGQ